MAAAGEGKPKEEARVEMSKVDLKFKRDSLARLQGIVTRRRKNVDDAMAAHLEEPTVATLARVRKMAEELESSLDKWMDAVDASFSYDGERCMQQQGTRDDLSAEVHGLLNTAAKCRMPAAGPAHHEAAQPGQGHGAGARARLATSLKPSPLTPEHTPSELRVWMERFRAYYDASGMEEHPLRVQRAYLWSCVEEGLQTRLAEAAGEEMPVLGDTDSCMAAIRAYFLIKYPVFRRRLDYYQSKQRPGEGFCNITNTPTE